MFLYALKAYYLGFLLKLFRIVTCSFLKYPLQKHPSQGIGVGLYISRQIIESFQGKIKVKNGKDGACFEIFLKLKERVE